MKVFISSLIGGFEAYRAAAKSAITTLRHEPLMAEDFGALPTSPQIACLDGVRQSDLVLLILGESYGTVQPSSGISATHEEFIEAKDRKQVLAFVQEGVTLDSRQAAFVQEVQAWSTGLFRAAFRNADELRDRVTTALHDYDMKNVTGPVDPIETLARATQLVSTEERGVYRSGSTLILSAAGAALQPVLRPTQIEDERLHAQILQEALFGKRAIFSTSEGNENKISGHTLAISQGDGKAALALNEQADIVLTLPFERERRGMTFPAVIEEDVRSGLLKAIGFTSDILEMIDPKERLSHVALVAAIPRSEHVRLAHQSRAKCKPRWWYCEHFRSREQASASHATRSSASSITGGRGPTRRRPSGPSPPTIQGITLVTLSPMRWRLRVGRSESMIVNLALASVLRETRLFSYE